MTRTKAQSTKDKTSLVLNNAISLALERNFPDYTHKSEEDHHESGLAEVSLTNPKDYSFAHHLRKGKTGREDLVNLDYLPSSDSIIIESASIEQDYIRLDEKGLTRLLWQETSRLVAKRNNVKSNYDERYTNSQIEFRAEIHNVENLFNSGKIGDEIKSNVYNILSAYKEMSRAPEILARLIVANFFTSF